MNKYFLQKAGKLLKVLCSRLYAMVGDGLSAVPYSQNASTILRIFAPKITSLSK